MTQSKMLPRDTNAALKDIIRTITMLDAVFCDEIKALKDADTQGFMDLQTRKIATAQLYESHMQQMIARKDELQNADPSLRSRLKEMYQSFSQTSQDNTAALTRMNSNIDKLGNSIRNAAIKAAQSQRGYSYGATGAIPNTAKKKAVSTGHYETV